MLLTPTRDTLPQRPRDPDAMQPTHPDCQVTRCLSSLPASPSILQLISSPFPPSLGPFSGPRFTFSGHSSLFPIFKSHPPGLPPARPYLPSSVLVRPLDLKPALAFKRRRTLTRLPGIFSDPTLPLCFLEPVATRHPPPVLRLNPAEATAHSDRNVSSGSAEDVSNSEDSNGSLPGPSAGDGNPRRR